jgi:hypothetical protein
MRPGVSESSSSIVPEKEQGAPSAATVDVEKMRNVTSVIKRKIRKPAMILHRAEFVIAVSSVADGGQPFYELGKL